MPNNSFRAQNTGTGVPVMNAVAQAVQQAVQSVREWSFYQQTLFDWAVNGSGNAIVIAVAGSGKTTTGVELMLRVIAKFFGVSHIVLAFNRAIADEMSSRGVNGRTFHSLCYSAVLRFKGQREVTPNKLRKLLDAHYDRVTTREYGQFMTKLVGLARNAGIGAGLVPNVFSEWEALVDLHDLEPESDNGSIEEGIQLAMELLERSNDSPLVDFDDLLYLAVKHNLNLSKFDWVLLDEAQDTNAIQRAILRKIMTPRSRLVAVGDPAQAIYGFRGADSNSMTLIREEFGCVEMPLTVTYRCPKSVVDYARQWVDHIEAAPGAPDGAVKEFDQWNNKVFAEGDLVVCRTTKPLVSLAYRLIRDRIPAHVMGKEIGQGLVSLINRMQARGLDGLVDKLTQYTAREVQKALERKEESRAESIQDKTDCILVIAEGLPESERTIPGLIRTIEKLFTVADGGVKLATIHKSKGLEANRVWWLNRSKCPSTWAKQDWQRTQEDNLCYVAATRAKKELMLIEETDGR